MLRQLSSWMSTEKQPAAIKVLWEAEEALTIEQRRARYKCGKKFVTADSITRWESYKPDIDPKFDKKTPVSSNPVHLQWFHKQFDISKNDPYAQWKEDPVINSKIATWKGNITTLELDAVLNAANRSLLGGGGIDGAIHSAAGDNLYKECAMLDGCETGKSKITRGYNLPAKYVIATVGPIGENPEALYNAYYNSLELAKKHKIRTFALCGVSTGIYGYPLPAATHIALATVRKWMEKNKSHVDMVLFCTFLEREVTCYDNLMPLYFPKSAIIPKRPIPPFEDVMEEDQEEGQEANNEIETQTTSTTTTSALEATPDTAVEEQPRNAEEHNQNVHSPATAQGEDKTGMVPNTSATSVGTESQKVEETRKVDDNVESQIVAESSEAVNLEQLTASLANTKI